MQGRTPLADQRAERVHRLPESVDRAAEQAEPDRGRGGKGRGENLAAGTEIVRLAERHEEESLIAKADDLRMNRRIAAPRVNLTHLTEREVRSFGFNDQPRYANDMTHALDRTLRAQTLAEPGDELPRIGDRWVRAHFRKLSTVRNFVARRPSTTPKRLRTMQSPGCSSGFARNEIAGCFVRKSSS